MEHTPAALSRRGYVLFVDSAISAALGKPRGLSLVLAPSWTHAVVSERGGSLGMLIFVG